MRFVTAASGLALALLMCTTLPAHADAPAQSRQQIEKVVEKFRLAIVNKDKDNFMKLFLREDITWAAAYEDASLDRIMARRTNKALPRPKKIVGGSPREFIDDIAKATEPLEETFENVRIDADEDVAQVWFDYSFKAGDYRENWGKEAWHLVRTEDGWKIASVIWSMKLNPNPPPAAGAK
ncbi:nuclear transport factor 2 family protein [Massilia sp. CCM 8733]|uniref:Nuclear transport factor 2 family protein n=1 Tax=Massilia mucilaginosa TaxID=2609282 RepID=A0ABX0NZU7_9BURK|nr:nuclear transport factor 2 family protein [Massilia mucilaginosa]NHZ92437.1 nuclear transport factor 2 family protein [Massilia mucilaginosa]